MKTAKKLAFTLTILSVFSSGVIHSDAISGYEYVTPETRAMQDDDFENPGTLTVDYGQELFNKSYKKNDKNCASCHGEQGENFDPRSIARYPLYDDKSKTIVTLQRRISNCRNTLADKKLATNHPELVALETFVRSRAHGEKVNVQTEGVAELLHKGEILYNNRYGLIDMSCFHCHTLYPGQMIRGQKISQGQSNGFPAYRLATGEIANLSQRIQQCMELLRADPFDADSEEIKLLQFYMMSRSNGLAIETPAVRY